VQNVQNLDPTSRLSVIDQVSSGGKASNRGGGFGSGAARLRIFRENPEAIRNRIDQLICYLD
jgi:hypothetical protein